MFLDDIFQMNGPVYPVDSDQERVLSSIDEAEDLLGVSQAPSQYVALSPDIDKKLLQLIDMTALG